MQQGVKADGDAALYLPKGADLEGDDAPFVLLVPVTSFDEFKGNLQNAQEQGGVTAGELNGEPVFVSDMGDYAAVAFTEGAAPTEMPGEALDPSGCDRGADGGARHDALRQLRRARAAADQAASGGERQGAVQAADHARASPTPRPASSSSTGPSPRPPPTQLFAVAHQLPPRRRGGHRQPRPRPRGGHRRERSWPSSRATATSPARSASCPRARGSMLSGLPQGQYLMFGGHRGGRGRRGAQAAQGHARPRRRAAPGGRRRAGPGVRRQDPQAARGQQVQPVRPVRPLGQRRPGPGHPVRHPSSTATPSRSSGSASSWPRTRASCSSSSRRTRICRRRRCSSSSRRA